MYNEALTELLETQFQTVKLGFQTTRHDIIHTDPRQLIVSAAALSPEGLVVMSVRHGDSLFYGVLDRTINEREYYYDWKQGFVTNTRVFLTRQEAWIVAERQGQIRNPDHIKGRLHSEHLY